MSDSLRFAQYIDSYSPVTDGVVTVVKNYAYWLNQKYAPCTVFAPGTPGYEYEDPFEVVGYKSFAPKLIAPYRAGLPAIDRKYRGQVRDMSFDLIHCHSPFTAGHEALRVAHAKKIPLVTTFHSQYYDDFKKVLKSERVARFGVKKIVQFYNQADSVWAVNESTAKTLRNYGYQGDITVMRNGTDLHMPPDIPAVRAHAEALCGIHPDEMMFLFVGQHDVKKNVPLILDAAGILRDRGYAFKLFMVGRGPHEEQFRKQIETLQLTNQVKMLGTIRNRDDLTSLYVRANALVFPSLYDNAALVIQEAACLGCPSIMVKGSNVAEGATDHENAYLCENHAESTANCMQEICDHPLRAKEIGARAQQTLPRTWESIVDDVYQKYLEIMESYKHKTN